MEPWEPVPDTFDICGVRYNSPTSGRDMYGMGYDKERGLIYCSEYAADGDWCLVHAWQLNNTTSIEINVSLPDMGGQMHVWPNPFAREISISLDKMNGSRVNVQIFNTQGRLVYTELSTTASLACQWQAQGQPAGVYVVRVTTGSAVFSKQVLLVP
jgi:hypothetical protein